jgi:hypothetical protein
LRKGNEKESKDDIWARQQKLERVVVLLKQTDRGLFHDSHAMIDEKIHEASPKIHGADSLPNFWPFRGRNYKKATVPFF